MRIYILRMLDLRPAGASACIALFDLDGTLTWGDTLLPFLLRYARRRPLRLLRFAALLPAALQFSVDGDRGRLKSRFIRAAMGGDPRTVVEAWADQYVAEMKAAGAFRSGALSTVAAHRAAGDRLVLLSASPDLYVPRIGSLLGFERTVCTEILWRGKRLDGALSSANRRGEEKCRSLAWVRTQYPGLPVIAYGNAESDLPHLRQADRALLVNATAAARRAASNAGIASAEWT